MKEDIKELVEAIKKAMNLLNEAGDFEEYLILEEFLEKLYKKE